MESPYNRENKAQTRYVSPPNETASSRNELHLGLLAKKALPQP